MLQPWTQMIPPWTQSLLLQLRINQCRRKVDDQQYTPEVTTRLHNACSNTFWSVPAGYSVYRDEDVGETFVLNLAGFQHADVGHDVYTAGNITEAFNAGQHDKQAKMKLLRYAVGKL